jgi:arylsulfatase A-like enzyme
MLTEAIRRKGIEDNTIFVFTSDHGDMLGSRRKFAKQWPYDESILVPFVIRYPGKVHGARQIQAPLIVVDIMPTLLRLAEVEVPRTVQGSDFSGCILGNGEGPPPDGALIMCVSPFLTPPSMGIREYRGIRTSRYTYARVMEGPWLLFDNEKDPYQEDNLVNNPDYSKIREHLENKLQTLLDLSGDEFLSAEQERFRRGIFIVKDDDAIPTY